MPAPVPDPAVPFENQPEQTIVAMAVFGEALNQTESAQIGMLNAVRNRLIYWKPEYGRVIGMHEPRSWHSVLLKPFMFDCFKALSVKLLHPLKFESQAAWEHCYNLAGEMLNGQLKDNVERSTHYFDKSMDAGKPFWARSPLMEHVMDIDDLRFYRYK